MDARVGQFPSTQDHAKQNGGHWPTYGYNSLSRRSLERINALRPEMRNASVRRTLNLYVCADSVLLAYLLNTMSERKSLDIRKPFGY